MLTSVGRLWLHERERPPPTGTRDRFSPRTGVYDADGVELAVGEYLERPTGTGIRGWEWEWLGAVAEDPVHLVLTEDQVAWTLGVDHAMVRAGLGLRWRPTGCTPTTGWSPTPPRPRSTPAPSAPRGWRWAVPWCPTTRCRGGEPAVTAPGVRVLGGRYELRGVLGSGGMGVVHDGWDARLHRPVAVKELRPELAGQPEVRRRFEAEARAAATLSHPHVVAVYDTGEDAGVPWIVMERMPGPSLAELLRAGPLPQAQVRAVLEGVLGALVLAHDHGILHRDVKPGNVLVTGDGAVKVTDFGIAKSAGATEHTATGMVLGTVAYLSPARLLGAQATAADDLWATGVLAWECLLGHRPFDGDNLLALARAISAHPTPPVSAAAPGVDPVLAGVIDRLLTRDPAERYPDARAPLAALRAGAAVVAAPTRPVTRVLPAPAAATRLEARPAGRRGRVRQAWLVGAGVVAALVLGALALLATDRSGTPPAVPATTAPTTSAAPTTTTTTTPAPAPTTTAPSPGGGNGGGNGNGKGGGKPGKGNG